MNSKICVVTGGANGIGRCITEEFLKLGHKVAIIDIDPISIENLKYKYPSRNLLTFLGDVGNESNLNDFVEEVISKFNKVDYLINNAYLSNKGILSNCSYEDFNASLKVSLIAPYYLTKEFLPYFNKGASIVNISSTRAFMSQEDTESYSASKGGIVALTHALSISLSNKVRVNSISPGWIDTGTFQHDDNYVPNYSKEDETQHPSGRIGNPYDIANMVIFLCSDKATFINGQDIIIDGGMSKQMIYHNDYDWNLNKND